MITWMRYVLSNRFVCGLNIEVIQKHLLTEHKLDLKRALELAQGMEATDKNAQELQENGKATSETMVSPSYNSASNTVAQMQEEEEIDRVSRYPRTQGGRPKEASGTGRSCY